MNINPKIVIIGGISLSIIAPYFFTQCSFGISFGDPNEIGDTIGGITAPIVGILGAVLIYLTFEQQNKAIQQPIDLENERVDKSKKLILLDLERNILPTLNKFLDDCIEFNKVVISGEGVFELADYEYTGLDAEIYNAVGVNRLFLAFEDELFNISAIYKDVKYLRNIKLVNIYRRLNEAEKSLNPSIFAEAELLNAEREAYSKNMLAIMQTVKDAVKLVNNMLGKYSNNA